MLRHRHRKRRVLGRQKFCDTEIEQFWFALGGNENVAGLQVAMDDEILMGELNGAANLHEQTKLVFDGQSFLAAEIRYRPALDIFHHEIGEVVVGYSAIKEPRDIGMLEASQNLAFDLKTAQHFVGIGPALEEFNRNYFV